MMAIDQSRQGKRSRAKGARGELEIRDLLRTHGWETAHRNFMSGGAGGGDLIEAIPDIHLEVKRCETLRLPQWWRQATESARPSDTIVIAHRANMQPWLGSMALVELMCLPARSWFPSVIRRENVRAELMSLRRHHDHPLVVHPVAGTVLATGLLSDLLDALRSAGQDRKEVSPFRS
jgi:hypothetical protein